MVLQHDAQVTMHGTAKPSSTVKVTLPWLARPLTTTADADGRWQLAVATPAPDAKPSTIKITDPDGTVALDNVLIGDVWICGGQSNMEMPTRGFPGQPAYGTHDLMAHADATSTLRLFQQPRDWSTTPKTEPVGGTWVVETPRAVGDFSVVGYVFGNYLHDVIDMPVGLVQCCWSNSKIETWMPREAFTEHFPGTELPKEDDTEFGWLTGTPTLLYNAMVNPWKGFPARGVIWYQGEANNPQPELYKEQFKVMVDDWKKVFVNDSLPFYYVQLAPFAAGDTRALNLAHFRKAQSELPYEMPNVAMATTGDLGDSIFIHPPRKVEVGERLARIALQETYGREGLDALTPIARTAYLDTATNKVVVSFDNSGSGLYPTRCDLEGFEVVDPYGVVHPAVANAWGNDKIAVLSPVKDPVEVRYGYHNYYESTLFNGVGVPASPFALPVPPHKKDAMMWFDASANIERFSHPDSIDYYMDKIAGLGFTHAAVCLRPITGYVIWDSKLAPRFKGNKENVEMDFDYLQRFIEAGHRNGIKVLASINTFCAANNLTGKGVIFDGHPDWASQVLTPDNEIVPITTSTTKYGGMVNPINPEYQEYILALMEELLTLYPEVDGIMLDRVRYDGITADFSDLSRREFEKYIGQKVKHFPADILSLEKTDDKGHFNVKPGKHYAKWLEWRTKNITDFMGRAREHVKKVNPDAIFSTYTGAWYPSYYEVGVNFASKDYDPSGEFAPQPWATPEYGKLGYAELIDLYTTGNYYPEITIEESLRNNNTVWNETDSQGQRGSWYCVQGSCQHLRDIMGPNRFLGGILVDQFYNDPDKLSKSIEMNLKASDGLMIFDIVHIIGHNLWPQVEAGMKAGGNI